MVRGLEEVVGITKAARKGHRDGYLPRATRLYPIVRPLKKLLDSLPLYTWDERFVLVFDALERAVNILESGKK